MNDRWLSMKETCEYLGVSHDTVRNWIDKKNMPAVKLGGCWKFKTSKIDEWIANSSIRKKCAVASCLTKAKDSQNDAK